jgi:nucleoside-diphosphate-sugar epimerase
VEKALMRMADDSFSPTYLRASTAYGVSPRLRFDLVTNNLTAWAFTTGKVLLKSDGSPWRPIVHIRDIALAYIAALQAPRDLIHNEAFNVGTTAENYQIREIAQLVEKIVPDCHVGFAADAGPDKRNYRVNCDKIARTLHEYKPQWTAERGVVELYNQYKETGLTVDDFEGPKFMRIAHIKKLIEEKRLDENLRWTD